MSEFLDEDVVTTEWPLPGKRAPRPSHWAAFVAGFSLAFNPRALLAWLLYLLGDLVSRPLQLDWSERWAGFWMAPYDRLMLWSVSVQGEGRGPWERNE